MKNILIIGKKSKQAFESLKSVNHKKINKTLDDYVKFISVNRKKIISILNENNFNDEDCILILRTVLNRSKRLLDLKHSTEDLRNVNDAIASYKPPIFWKEKDIVKKQIETWSLKEIKNIIYKTSNLEILVKKNNSNSINFIYDFINN